MELRKKEDRIGDPFDWTMEEFITKYKDPNRYYMVNNLPWQLRSECKAGILSHRMLINEIEFLFWMSSGGTSSVLHTDDYENINCVLEGSKVFTMIHPKYLSNGYFTEGPGYGIYSGKKTYILRGNAT